jgi:alpha-D-ribose 1-methylphosphonate 5-triphosphate synthase subunit PhnG
MLQKVDNAQRSRWMGLLARSPIAVLQAWSARQAEICHTWLRPPETGLLMVRGRAGGTGDKFNLGEMTITRCALRLESGVVGVAYVQGRSHRKAEIAALADALLQQSASHDKVQAELIEPLRVRLEAEAARMQRKAQATRVEFFALARAAGT